MDRRLYMPEEWLTGDYAEHRQECDVPTDLPFRTEPELAWEMIDTLRRRGALPFRWVTFDEHFGDNPELLDRVDAGGLLYLAEVPHDTRVWVKRPKVEVPPAKMKGRPPTRERLSEGEPDSVRVDKLAEHLRHGKRWLRYEIKEGAKGPMVAEFAFVRAVAARDGLPGPDIWVVLRRSLGEKPHLKAYLCDAPATAPHAPMVRVSGMRWPVETAIEESKGDLGMDHYQVRGWKGCHHHMTMTFLARHFLVRLRIQLGGKIASSHGAAGPRAAERGPAAKAA